MDILPEEEFIDIEICLKEIKSIQQDRIVLKSTFDDNMRELGYE